MEKSQLAVLKFMQQMELWECRGACLLSSYHDKPKWKVFLYYKKHFENLSKNWLSDLQMCTHAIGDSANREILKFMVMF